MKKFIAVLAAVFVNVHPAVFGLFVLVLLDIMSGFARAAYSGTLSSDASFKGMTKKAIMLIIVAVAWIVQFSIKLPYSIDLGPTVTTFYCICEILSIIENAKFCGVPVPDILTSRLQQGGKKDVTKYAEERTETETITSSRTVQGFGGSTGPDQNPT